MNVGRAYLKISQMAIYRKQKKLKFHIPFEFGAFAFVRGYWCLSRNELWVIYLVSEAHT